MKRLALAALLLLAPISADAYSLSCGEARIALASGDRFAGGIVVGHLNGVGDMIAGLYCLTGSFRCACYSNLLGNDNFPRAYGQELASCPSGDPALLPALRAAKSTCG